MKSKQGIRTGTKQGKLEESTFGEGFLYPLGLFLKHAERMRCFEGSRARDKVTQVKEMRPGLMESLWFDGAKDHLEGIDISAVRSRFGDKIADRVCYLQSFCYKHNIVLSNGKSTTEDIDKALELAEEIMFLIDEELSMAPKHAEYR